MATYVSRPAWELRARSVMSARVAIPVGHALLVGFSALMRTGELGVGYWIDEGLSVGIAHQPLTGHPRAFCAGRLAAALLLLLNLWMAVAGSGEQATHVLSLVFALVTVPVAFWGAGLVFGRRAAWFAAVLAALNPYITQYAPGDADVRAGRPAGHARDGAVPARVHRGRAPGAALARLFGLVLGAELYTHNWALFLGAALFVAWLVLLGLAPAGDRRTRIRDGALGFGLAALVYLPWVPSLLFQAAHTGAPWSRLPASPSSRRTCRTGCSVRRHGSSCWSQPRPAPRRRSRRAAGGELTAEGRAFVAVAIVRSGPC